MHASHEDEPWGTPSQGTMPWSRGFDKRRIEARSLKIPFARARGFEECPETSKQAAKGRRIGDSVIRRGSTEDARGRRGYEIRQTLTSLPRMRSSAMAIGP